MTGSLKIEVSADPRKYRSHQDIVDIDGSPVLAAEHNYITIQGYYNGPDDWVAKREGPLLKPVDLARAVGRKLMDDRECTRLQQGVVERLAGAGYDGSLLKPNDLLIALDDHGGIVREKSGEPDVVICNFEVIWNVDGHT
jgi:hypothetical protein